MAETRVTSSKSEAKAGSTDYTRFIIAAAQLIVGRIPNLPLP